MSAKIDESTMKNLGLFLEDIAGQKSPYNWERTFQFLNKWLVSYTVDDALDLVYDTIRRMQERREKVMASYLSQKSGLFSFLITVFKRLLLNELRYQKRCSRIARDSVSLDAMTEAYDEWAYNAFPSLGSITETPYQSYHRKELHERFHSYLLRCRSEKMARLYQMIVSGMGRKQMARALGVSTMAIGNSVRKMLQIFANFCEIHGLACYQS